MRVHTIQHNFYPPCQVQVPIKITKKTLFTHYTLIDIIYLKWIYVKYVTLEKKVVQWINIFKRKQSLLTRFYRLLKPGQNKKGQKNFQLHRFLNTFLLLAAEKKYSKNGAAGNFFGPSYFVTALTLLLFCLAFHEKGCMNNIIVFVFLNSKLGG